jgi:hypothetical protein
MTHVHTRDEALGAIDRGLALWVTTATGTLAQATAFARGIQDSADGLVRQCAAKVAALEGLVRSLRPEDDHAAVMRQLTAATAALQSARREAAQIASVVQHLGAMASRHARDTGPSVNAARADLRRRATDLASYHSSRAGRTESPASRTSGESTRAPSEWLNGTGLTEVDLASVDFGDNPIVGAFGRGDATRADYRWAVQTWDDVVRPGVMEGMTRADFEDRDALYAAPALRRSATVYDLFLGDSDRLRLSRRPDGRFDVTNGRHRVHAARELGIRSLPGQVVDP